jgi:cobyrinic acid a,c-diamide synthase
MKKKYANMKNNTPRFMLAAPHSGSGKTTVTCALLRAIRNQGKAAVSFKCGPDYIDPTFHTEVLGVPSSNLDVFLTGEDMCKYIFSKNAKGADIAVIEGVMGYYDGLGNGTSCSSYHLARITGTPVILVINAKGSSLTLAAIVNGLKDFRADSGIKGVILNNAGEGFFLRYKESIEQETNIPVIGYLPELPDCRFESRRLGLVTAMEAADLERKLHKLAGTAMETIDFNKLFEVAGGVSEMTYQEPILHRQFSVTIAVAWDKAFCFYYRDALDLLRALGAEIVCFSPLADRNIPECDGLIFGGGYPELYLAELSANKSMLADVKAKIQKGIPCLAESGGFMYLFDEIKGADGTAYDMVGVVQGQAFVTEKLSRFGYVTLTAQKDTVLCPAGEGMNAHEFHYSDTTYNGSDFTAVKPVPGGRVWECIVADEKRFMGFPQIHLLGNIRCAERFLEVCGKAK